jgi:hypothetical protein
VTNRMRIIGRDEAGEPLVAKGQAMLTGVCVRVDWLWLLLPGGVAVLAIIVLAGTVVQSAQHLSSFPVWKSSLLPVLWYGVWTPLSGQGGEGDRPAELQDLKAAASLTVASFRPRGSEQLSCHGMIDRLHFVILHNSPLSLKSINNMNLPRGI